VVANNGLALFATRVADEAVTIGSFNQHVAAMTGYNQTGFE
jgi:hypothetical protein